MMLDRELKTVRMTSLTQETIVSKAYLGAGYEALIAQVQVFPHEGFREGDIVKITIEKKLEK